MHTGTSGYLKQGGPGSFLGPFWLIMGSSPQIGAPLAGSHSTDIWQLFRAGARQRTLAHSHGLQTNPQTARQQKTAPEPKKTALLAFVPCTP